jgi:hypothetical protein
MSKPKKPAPKKPAPKKPAPKTPAKRRSAKKPSADASLARVAKQLRVAEDYDKHALLLAEARQRSMSPEGLLWTMVVEGVLDLWKETALWDVLGEEPGAASTEAILTFLRAAPKDHDGARVRDLLPLWSAEIDRVVAEACRRDPTALEAAWQTLPAIARHGVASVLRRAEKLERAQVPAAVTDELARAAVEARGGALALMRDDPTEVVGLNEPRFLELVLQLTTEQAWSRALLRIAPGRALRARLAIFEPAIRRASSAELREVLGGFQAMHGEELLPLLLERSESAAWFHDQAGRLRGAARDICAVAAILRCKEMNERVPVGWEDDVTFEAVYCTVEGDFARQRHVEALQYLGEARAVARLSALNEGRPAWASLLALPAFPRRSLVELVEARVEATPLSTLIRRYELGGARVLGSLGAEVTPWASAARKRADHAGTRAFLDVVLEVAAGGKGTTASVPAAPAAPRGAAALAAMAARLTAAGAATTRVFLLERDEHSDPGERVSRIGGAPVGVSAAAWPRRGKGKDARMEHLLTLAAADLPGAALPDGAAAVALFVRNRDHNDATSPDTDETAVLLLSEDDLAGGDWAGAAPPRELEACGLRVTAVEVPTAVFGEDVDGDLGALRTALLQGPGYALGEPIWLQEAEDVGDFVCQLDASLVPMNLGDQGVLYVFTSAAFWQSA